MAKKINKEIFRIDAFKIVDGKIVAAAGGDVTGSPSHKKDSKKIAVRARRREYKEIIKGELHS